MDPAPDPRRRAVARHSDWHSYWHSDWHAAHLGTHTAAEAGVAA